MMQNTNVLNGRRQEQVCSKTTFFKPSLKKCGKKTWLTSTKISVEIKKKRNAEVRSS